MYWILANLAHLKDYTSLSLTRFYFLADKLTYLCVSSLAQTSCTISILYTRHEKKSKINKQTKI